MHLHTQPLPPRILSKILDFNSPYSSDLAPCDFFLFPKLQESLSGHHFDSDSNLMQASVNIITTFAQDGFKDVFLQWVSQQEKCIACDGRYFEKE